MWPDCLNNLSPVKNKLEGKVPKWVAQIFNKKGIFNQEQMLIPLYPIKILGTCKTSEYLECATIPNHHIENSENFSDLYYLDDIGRYYWFDFDLIGADNQRIELRMVFNPGDADCNDGFWGEVWERNTRNIIANILSTGDVETTIKAISSKYIKMYQPHKIEIINRFFVVDIIYQNNLQLEQLISLAIIYVLERNYEYCDEELTTMHSIEDD